MFLGPYAPASVGDYLAGPNHVLPTARTARFASALRVDDFRTHIHAVSMDAATLARLAPHVVAIARGRGASRPCPVRRRAGRAVTSGPVPLRPDLTVLSGYHSPQVEVEVRLNTNESPLPPAAGVARRAARRARSHRLQPLPRPRRRRASRPRWVSSTTTDPARVFCANGSNEVLQCLLLAYGGAGRVAALFEPTYALHGHIASVTATDGGAGLAGPGSPRRPRGASTGSLDAGPTGDHVPVLAQQSHRTRRATRGRGPRPGAGPGAGGRGRGLRTVRPVERARPHASAASPVSSDWSWSRTFSKTWSMAACRLGYLVADPAVVEACEAVVLPYHLDAMTQAAGRLALRHVDAMEARVALITEERGRIASALGGLGASSRGLRTPTSSCSAPRPRLPPTSGRTSSGASVLVRDCSSWPGLDNCLRVTVGTPEENDRFLAALRAKPGPVITVRRRRGHPDGGRLGGPAQRVTWTVP